MSADTTVDATTGTPDAPATDVLTLTPNAADKVLGFISDDEDADNIALRVAVQAGGCAGFRYALYFDDRKLDGDIVAEQHGVTIRIDGMSAPYMQGAVIDWKESLEASGFSIENPNAGGSCACGDSASF